MLERKRIKATDKLLDWKRKLNTGKQLRNATIFHLAANIDAIKVLVVGNALRLKVAVRVIEFRVAVKENSLNGVYDH